jgi:hypothetical protein
MASGREADAVGGLVLVPTDRQQSDWAEESAERGGVVWSPAQVWDWHLARAAAAENGRSDWRAAAFHLGVLAGAALEDVHIQNRLARAIRERDARPVPLAPPPRPLKP